MAVDVFVFWAFVGVLFFGVVVWVFVALVDVVAFVVACVALVVSFVGSVVGAAAVAGVVAAIAVVACVWLADCLLPVPQAVIIPAIITKVTARAITFLKFFIVPFSNLTGFYRPGSLVWLNQQKTHLFRCANLHCSR